MLRFCTRGMYKILEVWHKQMSILVTHYMTSEKIQLINKYRLYILCDKLNPGVQ